MEKGAKRKAVNGKNGKERQGKGRGGKGSGCRMHPLRGAFCTS